MLIGIGKMQTEHWFEDDDTHQRLGPVDMHEGAIYRSVDDGSLWVRPREEFEDGRFEVLSREHVAGKNEAEAVKGEHKLFEDFGVEYDDDCYVIRWESNDGRMDSLTAFKTGKIILTRSPFSGDFPPKSYTFDSLIAALSSAGESQDASP